VTVITDARTHLPSDDMFYSNFIKIFLYISEIWDSWRLCNATCSQKSDGL